MICQPIRQEKEEEIPAFTDAELIMHCAKETAKTYLELYLTEGLTTDDYSLSYQIYNEAILYIQRKRDKK